MQNSAPRMTRRDLRMVTVHRLCTRALRLRKMPMCEEQEIRLHMQLMLDWKSWERTPMAASSFLLRQRPFDASRASAVATFSAFVSDTDRNALLMSPKNTTVFCFSVCRAVGCIMAGHGGDLSRVSEARQMMTACERQVGGALCYNECNRAVNQNRNLHSHKKIIVPTSRARLHRECSPVDGGAVGGSEKVRSVDASAFGI
jgi:hypothetical protein